MKPTIEPRKKYASLERIAGIDRMAEVRRTARRKEDKIKQRPAFLVDANGEHIEIVDKNQLLVLPTVCDAEIRAMVQQLADAGAYIGTMPRFLQTLVSTPDFVAFANSIKEKILALRRAGSEITE